MKKLIAILTCAIMAMSVFAACGGSSAPAPAASAAPPAASSSAAESSEAADTAPAGDPIKIGLATVLTGDRAMEGEYARNAVEIVTQEINDAGGVLGRPVEVVIEDGLGTDVGAVNAYRKLADDPNIVAIIGSDNSNDNIAISAPALEAQILSTAQGSSPTLRDICNNDNPWLFQLRAVEETMIDALVGYAVESLGYKKFTIIHDTETNSSEQTRLFTEALARRDITPLDVVPFTSGTKDFTAHIVRMQQSNPEAIIGACLFNEAAIIAQQIRALGMDLPIFGSNAWGDPNTLALGGEAMNGVYSATAWVPNTPNQKGAAFAEKYQNLYNQECAKAAAQVYDHVSVICEAIRIAGTTDRAAVRDAMNTISDYKGAITTYDCRTNGGAGRGGLLVVIEDEKAKVLEEIIAES